MKRFAAMCVGALCVSAAWSAEVRVLSAGAVEPGLVAFAELAKRETGHALVIQFNTAPRIAQRLAAGEVYDVLISPPAVIAQAAKDGKVDFATVPALRAAVLSADTLVYNTASTGLYLDRLFANLGVADTIKAKTTRYPDGAAVMEHVLKGTGNQIGFGAMTEIRMYEAKGLVLVGPLPREVQNYTSYDAVVMTGATAPAAARAVLALLATPAGKAAFERAGVE